MKERASSTQSNRSSTSSTAASTPSSATPNATTQSSISTQNSSDTNNITDPFNKNNFMAPPIGGVIKCVTCLGNEIQGKVIAYDQQTKMLALSKFLFFFWLTRSALILCIFYKKKEQEFKINQVILITPW